MPAYHKRLQGVIIENRDWREILRRYDGYGPTVFMYLDPPYVLGTRSSPSAAETTYAHEMSNNDHQDLVEALLGLKAYAILSGYHNELYTPLEEAGWRRFDTRWRTSVAISSRKSGAQSQDSVGARQRRVTIESIWVCPPLVRWVSFVAPTHGWREARRGEPPPPVEELVG